MTPRLQVPCALTIAGSDSGGGAGVQADLKTFAAFEVHGASVITCLTAQGPTRVRGVQPCRPRFVREQLEAVFADLPLRAVKTGMLHSSGIVRVVVEVLQACARLPLVVDPVMVATSGATLLSSRALRTLCDSLLPLATLVTPNRAEAERLTGMTVTDPEGSRRAAATLHRRFGCAVLVKGGHLPGFCVAVDILFDGRTELLFSAPLVRGARIHGAGCTYSAAITAGLALGYDLPRAVRCAKQYITDAIANRVPVGSHEILRHV